MSTKVKRGLGLLVVAVIALVVSNVLFRVANEQVDGAGYWAAWIPAVIAGLLLIGSLAAGLVLLAVGLLRD